MTFNQSCRGKEAKEALLNKYDIRPISYVKLLDGQKKDGCCGEIKDRYYAFEFKDKHSHKAGSFFVGYVCGHEFLDLLNIDKKKYPLFNPLQSQAKKEGTPIFAGLQSHKGDPLNKEIYNAIHLIIISWNGAPYGDYANIINFIRRNPSHRVSDKVVKKVNHLISKDAKCRSLRHIVDELGSHYPSLKEFSFIQMSQIIKQLRARGEVQMNYIGY